MRTLAPIRVRACDTCKTPCGVQLGVCRLCGRRNYAFPLSDALADAHKHLRDEHPWPWSEAQLDTDGSGK